MLSRNCEYATDVESFEIPFHEEFNYIFELWKSCMSLAEFYQNTIEPFRTPTMYKAAN